MDTSSIQDMAKAVSEVNKRQGLVNELAGQWSIDPLADGQANIAKYWNTIGTPREVSAALNSVVSKIGEFEEATYHNFDLPLRTMLSEEQLGGPLATHGLREIVNHIRRDIRRHNRETRK